MAAKQAQATPDFSPENSDSGEDFQESSFLGRGCCCFWNFPCFTSRESNSWERISVSEKEEQGNNVSHWWDKGSIVLKKVREWSELVAGPKWKTFIRRFNRAAAGRGRPGKFQYDPFSYALNFDDGPGQNGHQFEDDRVFRDFSSRYAPSRGGSMDMGKDAPSFT